MTRALKVSVALLVGASAVALVLTVVTVGPRNDFVLGLRPALALPLGWGDQADVLLGLAFWTAVTLSTTALPVRMPRGTLVSVSTASLVAVMHLGGPLATGIVAAVGTLEVRELRGRVPWYGTLANHAGVTLPAILGSAVAEALGTASSQPATSVLASAVGAGVLFGLNVATTSWFVAMRTNQRWANVASGDLRGFAANLLALVPVGWLMAKAYLLPGGWWAALLFALPLYTTRVAYHRFVEMRDMFTQTIGALAEAVDKRDPFTSKHSQRVKDIAGDIGREMRLGEGELEALEWGGLLHDVGKIGVPDAVLLKQERLNREERMIMNAHPVLGAQIIAPVTKLAPELPIIRHHHEWYNGSGYPDRLIGDEIPKLARILHVADAFEAMTAQRPYRMTPLTAEQAVGELRKFAGIQFDPQVVDAFVRTPWVDGVTDPGRTVQPRPIPLIAQAANRITQATAEPTATTTN